MNDHSRWTKGRRSKPARQIRGQARAGLPAAALATLAAATLQAQVSVLTFHNDLARTGQNLNETILAPETVNTNMFGRLFYQPVDGAIYGQPLYVPNVAIPGQGTHNVIYVATQHDSVYAFDADSNQGPTAGPLWQVSFLNPAAGVNPIPGGDEFYAIMPEVGITSTPVVDPSTGTIYLDAATKETGSNGSAYLHRLHALDIATGAEKFGGPVVVGATVNGNGQGSDGAGNLPFTGFWQLQRSGLLLLNGVVHLVFASYADAGWYHGWVLGYNAATLQLNGAFNDSPNGEAGGIWMAGCAPAADADGNFYLITGNGTFDPPSGGFGDSFLKLSTGATGPALLDYFTPYYQASLADSDLDLGSGGAIVLPDSAGSAAHPHLMVGGGKQGTIYLVDRDNLGQSHPSDDDQIVQELTSLMAGTYSTPAYYNGQLYYCGMGEPLKAYAITNAQIQRTPVSIAAGALGYPGATPSVSANGATNGIVWVVQSDTSLYGGKSTLRAYDATDLSREIYNSALCGSRDDAGGSVRFPVPTIANGKVYVGGSDRVTVFGLSSWARPPLVSPGSRTFSSSLAVSLSSPDPGAAIHFTLDGTAATTNSAEYSTPIHLADSTVIRAISVVPGLLPSGEVTAAFNLAAPAVSLANFGANGAGWTLNGNASAAGNVLTLTDGLPGEAGSAFFNLLRPITNFTARFVLNASLGSARVGFVVQDSAAGPSALGQACLGYCGINPGDAVLLDAEPVDGGFLYTGTGFGTAGTPGEFGSTFPVDLTAGHSVLTTIKYDGTTLTEHLQDLDTGDSFETNYVVDIALDMGGVPTAFIGFTAASGTSTSTQTISDFSFGPYQVPSATILAPVNGTVLTAPANLTMLVSAVEPGGIIQQVTADASGTTLGTVNTGNAAFAWTNVTAGVYTLHASALDGDGLAGVAAPAVVTVIPPRLAFSSDGVQLTLSWPGPADYVLQTTTNVTPPAQWSTVPAAHAFAGGQFTVPVALGGGNRFFRLSTQ